MNAARAIQSAAWTVGCFLLIGTITALWANPFFVRMTPVIGYEMPALAVQSALLGVFVSIRRPYCSVKTTGIGTVAGFFGVACPICNKLLVFLFGTAPLLTYFEPVRWLFSAAGILITALAIVWELRLKRLELQEAPSQAHV
jgi:hypothetical protein